MVLHAVAPLSLVRLLQEGGERTYNSGVSQAFKGAVFFFFSIKLLPLGTTATGRDRAVKLDIFNECANILQLFSL